MLSGPERRSRRLGVDEALYEAEDRSFRREVWAFLERELDEDTKGSAEHGGEIHAEEVDRALSFMRKAVEAGLVTYWWPVKYGGQGGSLRRQAIINEAIGYFRAPHPWHTGIDILAPAFLQFGSDEQLEYWMPQLANGEVIVNNGLTEPDAGSDLANTSTRAQPVEAGYLLNGQKTFQSRAHYATHSIVLARTDPTSTRGRGLSMLLVDLHANGLTIQPQWNMVGGRQNDVFFEDVFVPSDCLIGVENDGWNQLRLSLGFERSGVHDYGRFLSFFDDLSDYLTSQDGPVRSPVVDAILWEMEVTFAEWRELCYRVTDLQEAGSPLGAEAAIATLKQKDASPAFIESGIEVLGREVFWWPEGSEDHEGEEARVRRLFSSIYWESRSYHARGTPEIQRNTIAFRNLGLPRV